VNGPGVGRLPGFAAVGREVGRLVEAPSAADATFRRRGAEQSSPPSERRRGVFLVPKPEPRSEANPQGDYNEKGSPAAQRNCNKVPAALARISHQPGTVDDSVSLLRKKQLPAEPPPLLALPGDFAVRQGGLEFAHTLVGNQGQAEVEFLELAELLEVLQAGVGDVGLPQIQVFQVLQSGKVF